MITDGLRLASSGGPLASRHRRRQWQLTASPKCNARSHGRIGTAETIGGLEMGSSASDNNCNPCRWQALMVVLTKLMEDAPFDEAERAWRGGDGFGTTVARLAGLCHWRLSQTA